MREAHSAPPKSLEKSRGIWYEDFTETFELPSLWAPAHTAVFLFGGLDLSQTHFANFLPISDAKPCVLMRDNSNRNTRPKAQNPVIYKENNGAAEKD